jgi:hypothetical protein
MLLRHSEIQHSFANIGHARAHGKAYRRIGLSASEQKFSAQPGNSASHSLHRPQISKDLRAMQAKVIRPRFD